MSEPKDSPVTHGPSPSGKMVPCQSGFCECEKPMAGTYHLRGGEEMIPNSTPLGITGPRAEKYRKLILAEDEMSNPPCSGKHPSLDEAFGCERCNRR